MEIYECRDRHGIVHRMHAQRHYRLNRDFPHFGPPLRAKGLLHGGEIAGCGYLLVRLTDLLDEVRSQPSRRQIRDPRASAPGHLGRFEARSRVGP